MNPPTYTETMSGEKGVPPTAALSAPYPPSNIALYPPGNVAFHPPANAAPNPSVGSPYPQIAAGPTGPPTIGFVTPGTQLPYPAAHQSMPGPPQVPQPSTQTVIVSTQPVGAAPNATVVQVVRVPHLALPPASSRYECPSCKEDIRTRVEYKTGTKTHLVALLLCLFGCWCCVPIPYCCSNDCKDAHHYCPHCGAYIGISARG